MGRGCYSYTVVEVAIVTAWVEAAIVTWWVEVAIVTCGYSSMTNTGTGMGWAVLYTPRQIW